MSIIGRPQGLTFTAASAAIELLTVPAIRLIHSADRTGVTLADQQMGILCSRRRRKAQQVGAALALLALAAASLAGEKEPTAATGELGRRYDLVRLTGRVWGLPLERELLSRLKGLPDLRQRIITGQREIDEAISRNALAWRQAAPAVERLQRQLADTLPGDPQRLLLADQLRRLQSSAIEPAQLASHPPLRTRLIKLAEDRCQLTIELAWLRRSAQELAERYDQLAADAQVMRLIEQTGEECRLGPLRNYAAGLKRLEDFDKLAAAPHAPVYWQGGRARVTAAVNDATCVTFTWSEASDALTFLPASVIEAAGIEIPPDAPREMVRIRGKRVEARPIVLSSLRVGSCRARQVPAYVLPPEAEHLGAQLTPLALSPCGARLEPAAARLVIER